MTEINPSNQLQSNHPLLSLSYIYLALFTFRQIFPADGTKTLHRDCLAGDLRCLLFSKEGNLIQVNIQNAEFIRIICFHPAFFIKKTKTKNA